MANNKLAIIGGSGLYDVEEFKERKLIKLNTPWGKPSDKILSFEYADNGIVVKDLTPGEIKDAVLELEARIKGEWDETVRDRILQNRFWEILKKHPSYQDYHGFVHPQARIGAAFLSANHNFFLQ